MGGRSGQRSGGGFREGIGATFEYNANDADVSMQDIAANNSMYEYNSFFKENWERFINAYTGDGYIINRKIVDNDLDENDLKFAKGLNASLDKLKGEKGIFQRGMRYNNGSRTQKLVEELKNNVGGTTKLTTFLSTSQKPQTASGFSGSGNQRVLFTVKGIGRNGKSVERISKFGTEKEVLFKAGTNYKINSYKEVIDNDGKITHTFTITEKR